MLPSQHDGAATYRELVDQHRDALDHAGYCLDVANAQLDLARSYAEPHETSDVLVVARDGLTDVEAAAFEHHAAQYHEWRTRAYKAIERARDCRVRLDALHEAQRRLRPNSDPIGQSNGNQHVSRAPRARR